MDGGRDNAKEGDFISQQSTGIAPSSSASCRTTQAACSTTTRILPNKQHLDALQLYKVK